MGNKIIPDKNKTKKQKPSRQHNLADQKNAVTFSKISNFFQMRLADNVDFLFFNKNDHRIDHMVAFLLETAPNDL